MSLNIGDLIDNKYRIVRLLGEGGMGAVYEGENLLIHRRVAIKVLHAGVAANADAVARFEREAQAAGRIGSEHIVEVLDLGSLPDGDRYMVMEFMDGEPLSGRLRSLGRMTPAQIAPIFLQMLDGLKAAHEAGIIHRDLKPDNVYLVKSKKRQLDFVKLLDFGISKFSTTGGEFNMTRTGAVMGTPHYMAPEQAKGGKHLDYRVDVYAAGVILYEAVSGQVPFQADTFNELLFKIVLEAPPDIEQVVPGIDPGFAGLIRKAMCNKADERFQSCAEFQQALVAWASATGVSVGMTAAATPGAPAGPGLAPGTGLTPSPWSSTSTGDLEKKVSKAPLFLGAGLVLVVVLAGVGYALSSGGGNGGQAAQAAALEEERRAADEQARAEADRLARERAKVEEAKHKVAEKLAQAKKQRERLETEKVARERLEAEQKGAPAKKQPAAAPVAAKAKAPAADPSKKTEQTSGSRKIRTSL